MMALLHKLGGMIALFVGAAFLLGQLFAGAFSLGGTLASAGGIGAGLLARWPAVAAAKYAVTGACALGLAGAALDVYDYYSQAHIPGNYYAWFLTAPFVAALAFLAVAAHRQ